MTDEVRWSLLARKKSEKAILEAFRSFREQGIEPILIKGWAAARNYPPEKPRFYGDIDLAVGEDSYDAAHTLVESPNSPVKGVDLHRELRHLDNVDWQQLFSRSTLVSVNDDTIRILAPEDHLRVLCVHWLTTGGENKERLFDILYAVENRSDSFDWSTCLDVVTPERRSWVVSTVGLAHKYLGLSLDGIPFADEARDLPEWLTACVEKGWRAEIRLRGLDESITEKSMFIKQMRKRLPPNPIQSTVFCEGMFDHRSRVGYQVRDVFGRIRPSLRRITRAAVDQYKWSRTK